MKSSKDTKNSKFFLPNSLDVSILIPTHNRAEELRRTLDKMKTVRRGSLSVEFVIIDNGSTDNTRSIVESFDECLPIRYLFEPRPGKNCALNYALDEAPIGEIVVFTDDDIDPDPNWLSVIVDTCKRWPEHSVFGGRIYVVWPHDNIPEWAKDPHIQTLGFSSHNISECECVYDERFFPFGPNFWIRRHILVDGLRFDETIGPRPKNRIMGSEASFVLRLRDNGYEFVYSPHSIVGHRIQPEALTVIGIWRRAYRLGRGFSHYLGMPDMEQLKRDSLIWRINRCAIIIRQMIRVLTVLLSPFSDQRVLRIVQLIENIGRNIEALRMARDEAVIYSRKDTNT